MFNTSNNIITAFAAVKAECARRMVRGYIMIPTASHSQGVVLRNDIHDQVMGHKDATIEPTWTWGGHALQLSNTVKDHGGANKLARLLEELAEAQFNATNDEQEKEGDTDGDFRNI